MTSSHAVALRGEETALVAAVLAEPGLDAPRLAYADWLLSLDSSAAKARGEFIRLQIELDQAREASNTWAEKTRREQVLLAQYRPTWEKSLRSMLMPSIRQPGHWLMAHLFGKGGVWGFRRGFVEAVSTSGAGFLDADMAIRAATPLRSAMLHHASFVVGRLAEEPFLDELRSLYLVSDMETDEGMELIIEGALGAGLVALEMHVPNLRWNWQAMAGMARSEDEDGARLLDEMPPWRSASPAERGRLRERFFRPSAARRLDPSRPTSEIDLLDANDAVYLGDLPREAGLWAIGKSYHDPEDERERCRRVLFFRPDTLRRGAYDELKASPYFAREIGG